MASCGGAARRRRSPRRWRNIPAGPGARRTRRGDRRGWSLSFGVRPRYIPVGPVGVTPVGRVRMVRKTREQVWRELDSIGEDEVRRRLAAKPTEVEEPGLIHEWLEQRDRVNSALADTSREVARRQGLSKNVKRAIGSAALIGVAAIALGFLLARRKR